jgi:hypothetical protein
MFNVILFTDAPYPHHKIRGYGVHRIASQIRANGYTCLVVDFSSALTFDKYKEIIDNSVGSETLMVGFSTTWLPYRWPEKPGEFTNQIPGHHIGEQHELSNLKTEEQDWRKDNLVVKFGQNNVDEWLIYPKTINPKLKIVLGGAKADFYMDLQNVDHVIFGIAETMTIDLLDKLSGKTKRIFKQKSPDNSTLKHVGIEWEFACKISQAELGALLYTQGFADIVTVKSDGSVNTREGYPHAVEVTALIPETNLVDVVTRLMAILAPLGEVNKVNAGMHVHLDARETVGRSGQDMFNKLVAVQKQLYAIVPSFRRSNQYCKKLTGHKKQWFRHVGRYHGINKNAYDKYRTIELRLHQATLDAPKVLHFVNLLIGIVEHSEVLQVTTVRRMVMALPLSADTKTAIIEREKKYKKTVTDNNQVQAA